MMDSPLSFFHAVLYSRFCMFSIFMRMSTSFSWTSWKLPMVLPNCMRWAA